MKREVTALCSRGSSGRISRKENLLLAINHQEGEYVPAENEIRNSYTTDPVIRRLYYKNAVIGPPGGVDCWGITWQGTRDDMVCFPVSNPIVDINKLDEYEFPDPETVFKISENDIKFLKSESREDYLVIAGQPYFLFERAWALMGLNNFMISLIRNPEKTAELVESIANFQVALAERLIDLDVDGVWFTEDTGHQHGFMMNPIIWRKIIKPQAKRIIDVYKQNNKIVFFHSCGHILPILGDLVDLEIDVFHPLQARANNLDKTGYEIKSRYGSKITFYGCVDSHLLMTGSPEAIDLSAKLRLKQFGKGGGYILAPDQVMPFSEENAAALWKAAEKYGRYPLDL